MFVSLNELSSILSPLKSAIILVTLILTVGFSACSSNSGGGIGSPDEDGFFAEDDISLSKRRWGEGNIPEAEAGRQGGLFADISFDYDSSAIPDRFHEQLKQDAEVLMNDPSLRAEIEGHCDKRGTIEYNFALGEERAKAVAFYLVNLGVSPKQLSTISYGEEIPLDPGETEEAFAKNRRAHFSVFRPKRRTR